MGNLLAGLVTYKGPKKENEDTCAICKLEDSNGNPMVLSVIADGLGGYQAGAIASRLVVNELKNWFYNHLNPNYINWQQISNNLDDILIRLNTSLNVMKNEKNLILGSTCSLLFQYKGQFIIKHVGDSRVYLLEIVKKNLFFYKSKKLESKFKQITEDHSYIQAFVNSKQLTHEEARSHPKRNVLTQCVGINPTISIQSHKGSYRKSEYFLLCSDGLHELYSKEDLYALVKVSIKQHDYLQDAAEDILNHCMLYSQLKDNISIILVQDYYED